MFGGVAQEPDQADAALGELAQQRPREQDLDDAVGGLGQDEDQIHEVLGDRVDPRER